MIKVSKKGWYDKNVELPLKNESGFDPHLHLLEEIFYMDCGAPRFVGPGAKKIYEYIMKESEKPKLIKNLGQKNERND